MKHKQNIYDLISNYLNIQEDTINLLEHPVDSDTQLEYFELSRNQDRISDKDIIDRKDLIFDEEFPEEQKKLLLVQLASISSIEAYRTIEKYMKEPDSKLVGWAYMALLESRLLLESTILEENRVLITTGLGGKGNKLRYFIVFFTNDGKPINKTQEKIIRKEINFSLAGNEAELEEICFNDRFAYFLIVLPVNIPLYSFFNKIIKECNEFGDFLFKDFIISNVKILSIDEIRELLSLNDIN
ncbi:MAG: hypothetical protein GX660_04615 [Clostridiaceae bacterium]|nr:hypothetical protein [Clostridiaceae bacterium]